jgi:hypothetical protein
MMNRDIRGLFSTKASDREKSVPRLSAIIVAAAAVAAVALAPQASRADEGGVSFWLPGIYGSLAAVPQQPGISLVSFYYHTSVDAGADVAFARQVHRGNLAVNFSGNLTASLDARADLLFVNPNYVFATPVLGGQLAVGAMTFVGRNRASVDATLTADVGPIGFTVSGSRTDSVTGFGDIYPQASLRWNHGVHNFMVYGTGDIPVGSYNPNRLANLGIGHAAIDGGGGYTYFNPQTGHEFSGVAGFTYNFENPDTNYKNGIDFHFDWGASQFLTKQLLVGLVGYAYQQVTGDSGAGDRVGDFKSRVFGIGPQLGYIFPLGEYQGYLNVKGYKEFEAEHRPEGWNVWLTFALSPAAAPPPAPAPRIRK